MMTIKYKNAKYIEYFSPEIKNLIDNEIKEKNDYEYILNFSKNLPENFYEKRKIGENDNFLCKIIRQDLIEDFIIYVNKEDYSLNNVIVPSIFETNQLLLKDGPIFIDDEEQTKIKLIEYAAFHGSIQIFKYLYKNDVNLEPSIWIYAIHGDDTEMIHILEENKIEPPQDSVLKCIKESIKCHHNHILNYIDENLSKENYLENIDFDKNYYENAFSYCFHYYNFYYLQQKEIEKNINFVFYYACQYDHFDIVKNLLNTINIDINKSIILHYYFINTVSNSKLNNVLNFN